jgi:hypothetical protein
VNKWIYFAVGAVSLTFLGLAEASLISQDWKMLLILVLVALAVIWRLYLNSQMEPHEFRRTYEASREAAYNALCGALAYLDYTITMRDPNSGRVQFKGGKLGPWIGRFGLDCTASVHQTADRESEIVIAGRVSSAQKEGQGFLIYPEALASRAGKILERVQATVVTYSVIDAASRSSRDEPRGVEHLPPSGTG